MFTATNLSFAATKLYSCNSQIIAATASDALPFSAAKVKLSPHVYLYSYKLKLCNDNSQIMTATAGDTPPFRLADGKLI